MSVVHYTNSNKIVSNWKVGTKLEENPRIEGNENSSNIRLKEE